MGDFSIQISTNLVNQLVDDSEKLKKKPKRNKTKVPKDPRRSKTKADQKPISDDSEKSKGPTASGWPLQQPPLFVPVIPPVHPSTAEVEAIRSVLQESERVVEKLQKKEESMVEEVTQRAKDLRDKEFKLPDQKPMPCSAESDACFQCYRMHTNNVLKCAHLVKNFSDCNRRARQQVNPAEKSKF